MTSVASAQPNRHAGVTPFAFAGSNDSRPIKLLQEFASAARIPVRVSAATPASSLSGVLFVGASAEAYVYQSEGIMSRYPGSSAQPKMVRLSATVPAAPGQERWLFLSSDATMCEVPPARYRQSFSITVPLSALALDLTEFDLVAGETLDPPPIAWHILQGLADTLAGDVDEWFVTSASAVDRYLTGIASLVLASVIDAGPGQVAVQERDRLRVRALALIESLFHDATLAPATIATKLDVSLRSLNRAFEGAPGVAEQLRVHRVEYAAELLSDPGMGHLQISQIARRAGFTSLATFGRSFGRTFDVSPHQYRATKTQLVD